jgi:hypothetical protein
VLGFSFRLPTPMHGRWSPPRRVRQRRLPETARGGGTIGRRRRRPDLEAQRRWLPYSDARWWQFLDSEVRQWFLDLEVRWLQLSECPAQHSTKNLTKGPADGSFAEWWPADTRQRVTSLPSVLGDTRQRRLLRHPGAVTATLLCRVLPGTRQSLCRVPKKSTRQRRLCRCTVLRALFAECDTRQSLCRVFFKLCRVCFRHSAKRSIPVVHACIMKASIVCHACSLPETTALSSVLSTRQSLENTRRRLC